MNDDVKLTSVKVDIDSWNNVNKQLVKEGHAVEYFGGKRK